MTPAPPWLIELLRPAPVESMRSIYADYTGRDGHAYALTAVRGELQKMSAAVPGTRNDTAFAVACRLVELARADWAQLDYGELQEAFMAACAQASRVDGDFPESEAWRCWFHAEQKAVEPAMLPVADHLGTRVDWVDRIPFADAGQGPSDTGEVPDGFEIAVAAEIGRLQVRREAERRLRAADATDTDFDQEIVDDDGLALIPGGTMLVDGYLETNSLARANGPSGHGKSFVVLDMGACVANGRAWHGRAVRKAGVIYAIGEGQSGMAKRADAWATRHQLDSTGIIWVPRALQVDGPEWPAFIRFCQRRANEGLIVLDTQARMTVGVKENDATEMGLIVAALDELRVLTGACVLLVHHRGLSGDHGRGSSAMKGAMTTEMDISRVGATVTVKVTKQKDGPELAPLMMTFNPVADSVVLISDMEATPGSPFISPTVQLTRQQRAAVAIVHALLGAAGSGLTRTEACNHARIAMGWPSDETSRKVVRRAWSDLIALGRVSKAQGREAHFFIDLPGKEMLAANPDKKVQGGPELYVPPPEHESDSGYGDES